MAVILVFLTRVMLFDNPLAWRHYMRVVPEDTLSWLSAKQALDEIEKRELISSKLNYLIIGSSLTYTALYALPSLDPYSNRLFVYGMQVMEYAFCEKKIEAFNPSRILLYITNYDLGHIIRDDRCGYFYSFEGLKFRLLFNEKKWPFISQHWQRLMGKSLTGYFLPEYRYSFIFRQYLEWFLGRPTPTKYAGMTPEQTVRFKINMQNQDIRGLSRTSLDINLFFLDYFLRFCRKKRINVVMLEGRINPLAETPQSRELSLMAFQKLKEVADKYDHVRFVPVSELMPLEPEDFRDMLHVKEESSSVKYSQSVMNYLQKMPPFPDR